MKNSFTYPIKAVSNLTGLSLHVIRVWEKRYNVVVPERTDTNRRLYSDQDVEKLKLLSQASDRGYSIGTIARYNIDELKDILGKSVESNKTENHPDSKNSTNEEKDYLIHCIEATKNLNPVELERELYKALIDLPQPKFIEKLITPFLEKIGDMWKYGDIRILNEHISTAVIRKILTSLIDNNSVSLNAPSILIATPKGQLHELGALIIGVIASSEGWNVTYMGPDLPAEEIAAAIEKLHPKIVALSIVYPNDDYILDKEMLKLKRLVNNGCKIIAGGRSVKSYESTLKSMNAKITSNLDEFAKELELSRDSINY